MSVSDIVRLRNTCSRSGLLSSSGYGVYGLEEENIIYSFEVANFNEGARVYTIY